MKKIVGGNYVSSAKWNRVPLRKSKSNNTTNCAIGADIFKRECQEFDNGTLIIHRDLLLGERV